MLSDKVNKIKPSMTVEITAKIAEKKRMGVDIIELNVGEPDFITSQAIRNEGIEAINNGFTKYTSVKGIIDLRQAICNKLEIDNNLIYSENEICVCTGAKQAIYNAIMATCNVGDEVIILTPYWVSYPEMVKIAGAIPVFVETKDDDGFAIDIKKIEKAITNKTKGIIINTPNNPSGAVYKRDLLVKIGILAVENNLYIYSDEVYEKLVYDGEKHISMASISKLIKEKTITINGFSKAYAMTGWRLGYAAGPEYIINAMSSLQGHQTSGANSISQKAAVEALVGEQETLDMMIKEFDKRRKFLINELNSISGIQCTNVKGAFYLMPNISDLYNKSYKGFKINDSFDFTELLLNECNVAVVPGDAFGAPNNIRIAYSNSFKKIEKAVKRMKQIINNIN